MSFKEKIQIKEPTLYVCKECGLMIRTACEEYWCPCGNKIVDGGSYRPKNKPIIDVSEL